MIGFCDNPRTEILRGLSFEDYCALPALNQSLLKCFSQEYDGCGKLFKYRASTPDERDTDALRMGRAFHTALLEPKRFDEAYKVLTPADAEAIFQRMKARGASKKSKAEFMKFATFADWKAATFLRGFKTSQEFKDWAASDREVLDMEEHSTLKAMIHSLWENKDVADEFEGVTLEDCEVSAIAPYSFRDRPETIQLKARFDLVSAGDALIDAKTTRCVNPRKFSSQVASLGYDIQAAFYLYVANKNGMKKKRFGFLAQEKTAPYLNCIHWIPEDWLRYARLRLNSLMVDLAEAIRLNRWNNPDSGMLMPPSYLQGEIEGVN